MSEGGERKEEGKEERGGEKEGRRGRRRRGVGENLTHLLLCLPLVKSDGEGKE